MGSNKSKKQRKNADNNKERKLGLKPLLNANPNIILVSQEEKQRKKKPNQRQSPNPNPALFRPSSLQGPPPPSSSSSDGTDRVQMLLEPYSKDQLIGFLCDTALADPALASRIRAAADRDVSHRKIFVHHLHWDATREDLLQAFAPFGPLDECNVVADKVTGRCKGYGFVLFRSRSSAIQALKQPQKPIKNWIAHCQLASLGPAGHASGGPGHHADTTGRKIYVSNVRQDASLERLTALFAKFGEIEAGPIGLDTATGKPRGFAIFVYKTQEGARKALLEPYKMFEGHQLHCQWHADHTKAKDLVSWGTTPSVGLSGLVGAPPQPVLAAVAAAQNLSLYSQNPAYAALLGQNPLLVAAGGINPVAALSTPAMGGGLAAYGGNSSLLGVSYLSQGTAGSEGMQFAQLPLGGLGGSYGGMSSYL